MSNHTKQRTTVSNEKEWWLRKIVGDGLEAGMYEQCITANGHVSQWNSLPNLVHKKGSEEPRMTFNYHYVYEDPPGASIETLDKVHAFLAIPSHRTLFQADIKHGYWAIAVHPDDRHYLAFHIPGLGQLQPTRMPQGTRTSSFTFTELMNIALGPIPPPHVEPSLLHPKTKTGAPDMAFYMDDCFGAPLGEDHEIGGRVRLRQDKAKKIRDWPVPQNVSEVKGFMGTVLSARKWIKDFSIIGKPLSRLQGKVDWRWIESEELALQLLKRLACTAIELFGWDPQHPVELFSDASGSGAGCNIAQLQDGVKVPIVFDSFTFSKAERNYDTYKRELLAIVRFCKKFRHMLNNEEKSTVWTDHKPLVGFMNAEYHEDIFARWAEQLRGLNIVIKYIQGKKNLAADGFSRVILKDKDCVADKNVRELAQAVEQIKDDEWFWKSGKGGYKEMLKRMNKEQRRDRIVEFERPIGIQDDTLEDDEDEEQLCPVGWTSYSIGDEGPTYRPTLTINQTGIQVVIPAKTPGQTIPGETPLPSKDVDYEQ